MFHILYGFVVSYVPVVPYGGWNSAKTLFSMASLKLTVFIDSHTSHTWIPGTDATHCFLPVT